MHFSFLSVVEIYKEVYDQTFQKKSTSWLLCRDAGSRVVNPEKKRRRRITDFNLYDTASNHQVNWFGEVSLF